nr:recombinase family protein [Flexivirga oryzae]
MSLDRAGDELGVQRQVAACRKFAAEHGWTVRKVLVDNDTSATSGKVRPAFEELLKSDPERMVVWHVDRLVRLTPDLERIIKLGVNVHAVTAGHLDLSNPAGRAVARTVTAWATYEGEQKALRQRAKNDQLAETGKPYKCQRAFGFERDGMTIRDTEAAELRKAADGVLAGRSLNALSKDLNQRGIRTATGKTWRTTTLKAALLSPRNAGLRRHRGQVIGPAAWPAILDETTATALRAILTDPSRSKRGPDRRYLLSGVMTCGKCSGPVVGAFVKDGNKGETYRCQKIHVTRKAAPIDEYVLGLVARRLAEPDAADLFAAADHGDELAELRDELTGARSRLDGLAEAFAAGDIDRQALAAGSRRLRDRIATLEAMVGALAVNPAVSEVASAEDAAEALAALPQDQQRQVIDALLTIKLMPIGRRGADVWEGLDIEWKGSK